MSDQLIQGDRPNDDRLLPDEILTPGVRDDRQRAYVEVIDAGLRTINVQGFVMSDVDNVDAKLLPALAREFSVEEFLDPELPDVFVRRFIKNAYELHAQKGYISGTRLGLRLLGIEVEWTQWWEMEPKGHHNTHQVTTYVTEDIFANEDAILSARVQQAALRIINATKRWSQDIDFRIGVKFKPVGIGIGTTARPVAVQRERLSMTRGAIQLASGLRIGLAARPVAVCRVRCDVSRGAIRTSSTIAAASTFRPVGVVKAQFEGESA